MKAAVRKEMADDAEVPIHLRFMLLTVHNMFSCNHLHCYLRLIALIDMKFGCKYKPDLLMCFYCFLPWQL